MSPKSYRPVPHVFADARMRPSSQIAFRYNEGGRWNDISWPDYFKMTEKLAGYLQQLGVKPGQSIAIMSNTRYHWAVADMAILGSGCITVPIYQSNTIEDVEFIINNAGVVLAFAEDQGQVNKLKSLEGKIPTLKHIVTFSQTNSDQAVVWAEALKAGEEYAKSHAGFFDKSCREVRLDQTATIVYTSGTTGQPKGVVLLHSCIASECEEIKLVLELSDRDTTLTFLPFAHIFGRVELWANVYIGWKMGFAESIDRISVNMGEIRPTFMMAVPRIFEKIYSKIISQVDDGSPAKKRVFKWAVAVGSEVSRYKREKKNIPLHLLFQYKLAYKLVFEKLNQRLGGNLRFMVSGGAPLSREIAEFFHAAGILILEGYGLSETTAAITVNRPNDYRFGSVGLGFGDVQLKIAEDGEILAKSAKIFKEYHRNPAATQEVFSDGWFHTGDIGEIDAQGFVRITDRKKDLIKTAGGKMIAPQKLENTLKTNKYISQVVIYGDKMKYLVALVTLNADEVKRYGEIQGLKDLSYQELCRHPKIKELVQQIIREKNDQLASYETIKNFEILPVEFTIEHGDLTPSLKVKRKHLSQKYESVIRGLYQGQ
ncbi:MAG: long-chain fatty acid--CoA ligase [Oligoflexia bacterium]|nr:long-chain fatty acid--CoA ligase [Oligoflexia bacterium]